MIQLVLSSMRFSFRNPKTDLTVKQTSQTTMAPSIKHVLFLIVVSLAILAAACGGEPDIRFVRGRTIEVHAGNPVLTTKMSFADDRGRHRVIRPTASNRQLALVEVTVVNRTSTVMPLLINEDAVELGDRRGERIDALDPFLSSSIVETLSEDEGKFAPLLWGEVQLDREFQVKGWVIFDVPKGLTLGSLWWNEIDEVVLDYVNYFKRR